MGRFEKSAPVFGKESKLQCFQCGGWFTTGNTAEKGFTVNDPALVGYKPIRGGACPNCHKYNVNKKKTKDESMSETDKLMDSLCEAAGMSTLEEAKGGRQLAAQLKSFHDMVRSHMADLKAASGYMQKIEPALKAALQRGGQGVVQDAVSLMAGVNKDMNSCHLPLGSVKDDLHRAVAVDLPDWKRKH
jgi:hypothetical protein